MSTFNSNGCHIQEKNSLKIISSQFIAKSTIVHYNILKKTSLKSKKQGIVIQDPYIIEIKEAGNINKEFM